MPALPPWPALPPAHGPVVLRGFDDGDVDVVRELSTDGCVPLIGTLPAHATEQQTREWTECQRGRWTEGTGYSFAVARAGTGRAVGSIGLWPAEPAGGRATAG